MLSHSSLSNYYYLMFNLTVIENKYSLTELENMYPFERDIYVSLYQMHLDARNKEGSHDV